MPVLFGSGCLFATETQTQTATATRTIRALCLYEGKVTGMSGVPRSFDKKLINQILGSSLEHLTSGVQLPVYYSNHDYDPKSKCGLIVGPFEAQVITETDLPDPNLSDLIGKYGIFTTIQLIRPEAIADYDAKLIKPISVGIDFKGEHFPKNAIYEISLVGFGAFPGAQLFGKPMKIDFKAMAAQALDLGTSNQDLGQFGLTLAEEVAEQSLMPNLYRLFDAFANVIREILDSDDADKDSLLQQATQDLAVGLASKLVVPKAIPQPNPLPPELFAIDDDLEDPTPEEEDMSQLEDLQAKFEQFKLQTEMRERYHQVISKANELFAQQKLTPAELKTFEAPSSAPEMVLETFALGTEKTPSGAIAELNKRLIELEAVEKYGTPKVRFGTRLDNEPLPGQTDEAATEANAFMEGYSIRSPLYPKGAV
jgi:hypothetical protein